jgi:hypothetical protein
MEVTVATFCKNYSFMTTIPTSTPSGPDSVSIDLSVLKLRVYYGGQSNINRAAFETAIRKVVRNSPRIHDLNWAGVTKLDVQYVGCAAVRSCGWTFNQFIDWMKDGHIYIFLAHPVQNISTRQGSWSRDPDGDSKEFWAPWNLAALGDQLSNKLSRRIGFPEALGCGIFTQDKLVVKRILASKGLCIPFFELLRTEAGKLSKDTKRALFR